MRRVTVRRRTLGLGLTVLLAGLGFWAGEVRADRVAAADRTVAAADRAEADLRAVTRAETALLAAERREHARTAAVTRRVAADADLTARIAAAEPVLAASAGKVTDDAVRQTLDAALDAARATLAAALTGAPQSGAPRPDVAAAASAVDAARVAVEVAQAQWQATADAHAAAKPAARSAPTPAAPSATAPGIPVWVTSIPTADGDGSNGFMPASAMCLIPWGTDQIGSPQYLRCDAASALTGLNDAFQAKFGAQIAMDLTYRSYDDQVRIRAYYGALAAKPGTSNHGLGLALDVQEWPDTYGFGTPRYEWLIANGPTFGWVAPPSVRQDAPYPEYWHFEYQS